MYRRRDFALVLALLLLVLPNRAAPEAVRAAGGVRLLEAMETSPASVVVVVEGTRLLGGSGHAAIVRVEDPIVGKVAIGTKLPIAWEELAAARAPRFRPGDRVLMALEPLPGASIWLSRLPDPEERAKTLSVAMRGDAFLRSPSLGTANLIDHYLALLPADRSGAHGIGYLAQLAALAEIPLAVDAVVRLGTLSDLDATLTPPVARQLAGALVRGDATPALEDALVDLIDRQRLLSMRDPLGALIAGDELAPAIVYAALAKLEGGLSPERTAKLLAQAPERYRQVGARNASGANAHDTLRALIRRDPSAAVRVSAIDRLVELRGEEAIPTVADALRDSQPAVRASAARKLGALGAAAVPELQRVVEANDADAARAAVVALALTGTAEGTAALAEIADGHPDESLRKLARVALGGDLGHTHD